MKEQKKIILSAFAIPVIWILSLRLIFLLPITIPPDFKWFFSGILGTLLALFITRQFSKWNNVSMDQIGLNWEAKTPKRLLVGFLIGISIAMMMLFIVVQLTELEISRYEAANIPMAIFWMLAIIPLAFMEEVAFRGFIFFKLEPIIGLRFTIIITSIIFAYYHDMSGSTFFTQLLGPGIWGIIYGLSAIWSRGVAVPTGIHVGANVSLSILGMKDINRAIWMIDYPSDITESLQAHTEMVGLIVQLFLLFFGVLLTEWYLRQVKGAKTVA